MKLKTMRDMKFQILEKQYISLLSEKNKKVSEMVILALTKKDPHTIKKLGFLCDDKGDIFLAEALNPCINNENVVEILTTLSLLTTWIKSHSTRSMTLFSHYLIDKSTSGLSLTCHKGCDACCHRSINIFYDELLLIKEYVSKNSLTIENNQDACCFLKDKICSIYDVRPISCRNHITQNGLNCMDSSSTPHIIIKGNTLFISAMINIYNLITTKIDWSERDGNLYHTHENRFA